MRSQSFYATACQGDPPPTPHLRDTGRVSAHHVTGAATPGGNSSGSSIVILLWK